MLPPASLQQQHRKPVPRRRQSSVPIDLFSPPPTISVQAPTPPVAQARSSIGRPQVVHRPRSVDGWLADVAVLATPPSNGPSPTSSPTRSFRSAVGSVDDKDGADWAFPLSGSAATEARIQHRRELFEQQLRVAELQRQAAQLALARDVGVEDLRTTTAKKGFWKDVKHRVASSLSLSNMTLDDAPVAGSKQRPTNRASKETAPRPKQTPFSGREAVYQTGSARPSFVSIRTNDPRLDVGGRTSILQPASTITSTSLRPQKKPRPKGCSPVQNWSEEIYKRPVGPPPPRPRQLPLRSTESVAVAARELPPKRSSSGFSLSSLLRGGSKHVKSGRSVASKLSDKNVVPRPETPVVSTTPDPHKRSSVNLGSRPRGLYDEYRKPSTMTRSASGPLLSSSCHHCGGLVSEDGRPISPPIGAPTYMESLFAAIERRLSETVQSDSSGETVTENKRQSLPLEGSGAPVILNFFPTSSTRNRLPDRPSASTWDHYDPESVSMDRSTYYVLEKRALAKFEKAQRLGQASVQVK